MKKLFILLLLSNWILSHASHFNNNEFNLDIEILDDFSVVKVKHNHSKFNVHVKSFNRDQLREVESKQTENELDVLTLESIPLGTMFLEFFDASGKKILTMPAQELKSFSSHDADVDGVLVEGKSKIYQVKIPKINSLEYANLVFKESSKKFREISSLEFEGKSRDLKREFFSF